MESTVKTSYGKVGVYKLEPAQYGDKVMLVAEQEHTKTYPSGNNTSGLNSSLDAFGLASAQDGKSYTRKRYAMLFLPTELKSGDNIIDTLSEEGRELVAKSIENGHIFRIESNNVEDILSDNQRWGIKEGYRTLEDYKESLPVKNSDGELIPDANGEVVYFANGLSGQYRADESSVQWRSEAVTKTVEENPMIIE